MLFGLRQSYLAKFYEFSILPMFVFRFYVVRPIPDDYGSKLLSQDVGRVIASN